MKPLFYCLLFLGNQIFNYQIFAQESHSFVVQNSSICFFEDFNEITAGNNTSSTGSNTLWTGNENFTNYNLVYQAGGAIRIGNSTNSGSITSKILDEISGNTTLTLDVKGWTNVEGDLLISLGGTTYTKSYTARISDSFESITLHFAAVPVNSTLRISTSSRRAFIDNIQLICNNFVGAHTDFYRSKQSGSWSDPNTWESSPTGMEGTFQPSFLYPNGLASKVNILSDHHVEVNSPQIELTNLEIFGTLEISGNTTYSVMGDEEIEVRVKNGGNFLVNTNGTAPIIQSKGLIETGGKLIAGPNITGGTAFANRYIGISTGFFSFDHHSVFEWNNSNTVLGSITTIDRDFFRRTDEEALPIFRILTTPKYSFGSDENNVLNCILDVAEGAEFGFRFSGEKTILGGIQGNGLVFQEFDSGNLYIGNSIHEPYLDGSIQISIQNNKFKIPNGLTVKEDAEVQIFSNQNQQNDIIHRMQGDIQIYGSLDIHNLRIENTTSGGIFVHDKGEIRTRHTGGLFGAGSAIVQYDLGKLNLLEGSKVDYYADESQLISSLLDYYHIQFSGNGEKIPQNIIRVHTQGSVEISDQAVANFSQHNLGLTSANNTQFIMNGGRLILGTGGVQPRMDGLYELNDGVIEFTGNSAIQIRVGAVSNPKLYRNIEISGSNVKAGTTNFTGLSFHEAGKFSVLSNGIFKVPNPSGFIGSSTSAIKNAEVLAELNLDHDSTIEYNLDEEGIQIISVLENGYGNLKLTGISTKIQNGKDLIVHNKTQVLDGNLIIPTSTDEELPYVLHALNGLENFGGTIVFENNALLMQNPGVSNLGNIQLKRNAIVPDIQYNFWSSPVREQVLYDLYPDIPINRVMVYNPLTDFYTILPTSTNPISEFGKGYSIKGSTSMQPEVTATFVGIPQNESLTESENQVQLSNLGARFNLVGNPFPSNLDLVLVFQANSAQFNQDAEDSPHYLFWDNTDNDDLIQQGPDYVNQNFALYHPLAQIGISAPRFGSSGKRPNGIVKPGQGFLMRASPNATHIQLTNEMRTTEIERGNQFAEYFRGMNSEPNQFHLEFQSPTDNHIEIAIAYSQDAEDNFDLYDAKTLNDNASENFYSISSDSIVLVIQSKKLPFHKTDEIQLGYKISESGNCQISLKDPLGIFQSIPIYIWDSEWKISHNLQHSSYQFSCSEGSSDDRFQLHFRKKTNFPSASDLIAKSEIISPIIQFQHDK